MDLYVVGDTNGTFLSKIDGEKTTSNLDNIKTFERIGDALKECVDYNKNAITFRVMSLTRVRTQTSTSLD